MNYDGKPISEMDPWYLVSKTQDAGICFPSLSVVYSVFYTKIYWHSLETKAIEKDG